MEYNPSMQILEGKPVAEQILSRIKNEIIAKPELRSPRLEIFLVGDDFSSQKYVEYKRKAAENVGIIVNINKFDADTDKGLIISKIEECNTSSKVDGIMVQLPLPAQFNEEEVVNKIISTKDVDGLTDESANTLKKLVNIEEDHIENVSSIASPQILTYDNIFDQKVFIPATAMAIIELLRSYNISVPDKNVAVVGASKIVGMPVAVLLALLGGKVRVCNSKTINAKGVTQEADIVISATGVPCLVKKDWLNEGAVVVDVGFTKDTTTGKVVGDVDFESVSAGCSYISKAVGGVGPVTIACLLLNTFNAWKKNVVK